MSWIEDEAKKIKEQDDRIMEQGRLKEAATNLAIQRARVLPTKAPVLWQSLVAQCRRDWEAMNKHFEGTDSRQTQFETPSAGILTIMKEGPPPARVSVTLERNSEAVRIEFYFVKDRGRREPSFQVVSIDMDENENVSFASHGGVEGVSRLILEPIMKTMESPD